MILGFIMMLFMISVWSMITWMQQCNEEDNKISCVVEEEEDDASFVAPNPVSCKTFNHYYTVLFVAFLLAALIVPGSCATVPRRLLVSAPVTTNMIVSVDDFGAKGDGVADNSQAFENAWNAACSSSTAAGATLNVPNKTYLTKPIKFSGPCSAKSLVIEIYGTIIASSDRSDYIDADNKWLAFDGIDNMVVQGGGTINGNGQIWWQNSCKVNKHLPCKQAPTAVTFSKCKNLTVSNLNVKDAQNMHVTFYSCIDVQALNLVVTAPGNSPNTDGIHVSHTENIHISNCTIGTGDDCISIVSGSKSVNATNITCGPGHGISIGSLGADNSEAHVSGVTVDKAKLYGTTNGVRIKTYQGGSGSANNITFENIEMHNVTNPIIIDQNYCDKLKPTTCVEQKSAVQVKNVLYKNITGTSAREEAIVIGCSKSFHCQEIVFEDIEMEQVITGQAARASCINVNYTNNGIVQPHC